MRQTGNPTDNEYALLRYSDEVTSYLEYIGYPELVLEFNPADVATSMFATIVASYLLNQSPRLTAVLIWSMTMNFQVIPTVRNQVKH